MEITQPRPSDHSLEYIPYLKVSDYVLALN
jgi:hypothetical protein